MTDIVEAIVAKVSDIKDGEMKEFELGEGKILLIKEHGKIFATGNKCTHYGASLKSGALCNGRIRCPWHGACFSVETGDIEDFPGMDSIHTFQVTIIGEDIKVSAPVSALKENWKRTPKTGKCTHADKRVFVVIGAGAGGVTCVETLRSEGFTGRIIFIGKEKHLPYDRVKLSKTLNVQVDKILLRNEDFFKQNDVELILNTEVTELDAAIKTIKLSNNQTIQYDAAFVSTGGIPRQIPAPGNDMEGIYPLRTPEDGLEINNRMEGKRVVVVGSSFIGMEMASSIAKKAKSVVVIGMENVPFERVLGERIGTIMQKLHEKNGVSFRMKRVVREFRGVNGKVLSVLLDNGEVLDADLCIVGAGIIPATKFFKNVKMERDASIICDDTLKAVDVEGLYTGGDICRYPYWLGAPNETVRVEHWGMAQFHGKIAAQNMLGKKFSVRSVPYFWTTQYGKRINYCGFAYQFDELHIEGSLDDLKFVGYYIKENKVLACVAMGMDPIVSAVAELMQAERMSNGTEVKSGKIDLIKLAASI